MGPGADCDTFTDTYRLGLNTTHAVLNFEPPDVGQTIPGVTLQRGERRSVLSLCVTARTNSAGLGTVMAMDTGMLRAILQISAAIGYARVSLTEALSLGNPLGP